MFRFLSHAKRERPLGELPAPEPSPLTRPARSAVLVLIIVTVAVLWLITGGMPPAPALGVAAGIGVIACEIVARLSGHSGGWSPWLMRPLAQPAQA